MKKPPQISPTLMQNFTVAANALHLVEISEEAHDIISEIFMELLAKEMHASSTELTEKQYEALVNRIKEVVPHS
jgi:hypothetical protein